MEDILIYSICAVCFAVVLWDAITRKPAEVTEADDLTRSTHARSMAREMPV